MHVFAFAAIFSALSVILVRLLSIDSRELWRSLYTVASNTLRMIPFPFPQSKRLALSGKAVVLAVAHVFRIIYLKPEHSSQSDENAAELVPCHAHRGSLLLQLLQ